MTIRFNIKKKVVLTTFFFFLLVSCGDGSGKKYEVVNCKKVKISFDLVYDYSKEDHFYLDDHIVTHDLDYQNRVFLKGNELSISPKVLDLKLVDGTSKIQPVSGFFIAESFYLALLELNKRKNTYKIHSLPALRAFGQIYLTRIDGKGVELKIPKNYPLKIEVLDN